ncbi:MAG: VanZ family protein [Dechloromonas sp.]|uniref:VanZ family protein n=1 Tax=Candidatus Dechloromonas phosphorivorans TaxID=2899244 RepID=A0A9D7LPJ1_9RHOO|nr:VanZ family protein [Candidatus Dechloromonas phosphorivorans]
MLAKLILLDISPSASFPIDILLSSAELEQKMHGDNWGWLLAGDPQGNILIIVKLLSEIALTLPFGLFLGYRSKRQSATLKQAAWSGLLLGCFIEIAQFFTASGVSQGFSVLTRIVGVCGGLAMWNHRANWTPEKLAALLSRYALPLATLYLLALLQVNGWFSRTWNGPGYAAAQLDELHFLPFYYHYFTTEAKALFSLASVCLMYVPIGLLTWSRHGLPSHAFLYALFLASIVETGKLFLQDMHPDPTNIMLGALASWAVVHIARQLSNSVAASANPKLGTELAEDNQHQLPAEKQKKTAWHLTVSPLARAVMFATLIFATYWAATFPTQPMLLSLFLLISAATIWRRPALIICIIPAALPILDLAPWSGRFFFDEFDLLILISLAIGYTRLPPIPKKELHTDPLFTLAVGLLTQFCH